MNKYKKQVNRIKRKLWLAKIIDWRRKVFGAKSHNYKIGKPVSENELIAFEEKYSIVLPEDYKVFLKMIGNGGTSRSNSAAGPYYGIDPLGVNIDLITDEPETYLSKPVRVYPNMTDENWSELIEEIENNKSGQASNDLMGEIYGGILPIGSQGCAFIHSLVLNGKYKGKVINLELPMQKPKFAFDDNFLDWYERWLDEIISGELLRKDASPFGYTMKGTGEELLEQYCLTSDCEIRKECLLGILDKKTINTALIEQIEKEYHVADIKLRAILLQILSKFDFKKAKPYLIQLSNTDLFATYKILFWYAKDKSSYWLDIVKNSSNRINEKKTFISYCSLLQLTNIDYFNLLKPFTQNSDPGIRKWAFKTLGSLNFKPEYLETFVLGLRDNSKFVITATLESLSDVKEPSLLKYYKEVSDRFPSDKDVVYIHLVRRLNEMGLSLRELKDMNFN